MAVRIGFVGAGGIAGAHMNALEQIEEARVVAFADLDEGRASKAAGRFGARSFTDARAMLDQVELDAIFVCVPPLAHSDAEILAAERGLAVFVEKPVALTMAKAREIERAIAAAGVVSSVGYHWRNYDLTDTVRDLLENRTISMAMGYWMGGLPGVGWWRRMDGSGGQMVEQTTHIIDLARYLVGEIEDVYAAYALRALGDVESLDVPDVGTMVVRFAGGAVGHIANSCLLGMGYTVGLNLIGKGLVVEHRAGTVRIIEPHETRELKTRVNPTVVEDRRFLQAVLTGDRGEIRSPYSDAVRSLAVSLAANLSAERGEKVAVAEVLAD